MQTKFELIIDHHTQIDPELLGASISKRIRGLNNDMKSGERSIHRSEVRIISHNVQEPSTRPSILMP